ncbi:MAG: hypothetical protein AB1846_14245 [Chloroflexota bacterium]
MSAPRGSKRFTPSFWTEKLVPAALALLVLVLLATVVITGMALLGLTPGA